MRSVLSLSILAVLLGARLSSASDGLTTTYEPDPPYPPGTQVRVRVTGPGMNRLDYHATYSLIGNGPTDYMQSKSVNQSGNPPGFEWTFTAPQFSNTERPSLTLTINSKNGVQETLNAGNTPAFAPQFTGITIDKDPPKLSDFKFERTSPDTGIVTYSATDPAGVDSTGGGIRVGGSDGFFGIGGSHGTYYSTEHTTCEGSAPNYVCTSRMTFPPGAEGKLVLDAGVSDSAGNRADFEQEFDLGDAPDLDDAAPAFAGPVRVSVCADGKMKVEYDMTGGGGGIFQGHTNFWSDNDWLGKDSSTGIASQGQIECSNQHCVSIMDVPELVALEKGGLNAQVGNETSGSGVGGIKAGNNFRIEMAGLNTKRSEWIFPQSVVDQLLVPVEPQSCNLYDLTLSEAKPVGTVPMGESDGTR